MFNLLYDESINCRLVASNLVDDRTLNWNRINASICFNYLQQEFYFVKSTMKTLAGGKSNKTILKVLRILINTSQSNFGDLNLDDDCVRDIADVLVADLDGTGSSAAQQQQDNSDADLYPKGAIMTSTPQDVLWMGSVDKEGKSSA